MSPTVAFVAAVVLLALVLAIDPVAAGSIEIRVRERGGAAVEGQQVSLRLHPDDSAPWTRDRLRGTTDARGLVRFDGVEPASYSVRLGPSPVPELLRPEENPYVASPVVTLVNASSSVQLDIELWRGLPTVVDVLAIDTDLPGGKVMLRHVETGELLDIPFRRRDGDEKHDERPLVEGRWQSTIDAPPGFLVRELRVNGEALPGPVGEFDTSLDPRTQFVYWELSAPCEVWGRLVPSDGASVSGVTIVAELLEAGPWIDAESARGRSHHRVEPHWWEPHGEFHIRLPDGIWRVRPDGDGIEETDPASVDLVLSAGQVVRQDFTVAAPDEDGRRTRLQVTVVTPDGSGRVGDAFVALYRAGGGELGEPLQTGRTREDGYRKGRVSFEGLDEGAFEIVAGHRDWLDGRTTIEFDPEQNDGRASATVRLERGSTLRAVAFDHDTDPRVAVPDVEITVERVEGESSSPLTDERLEAERLRREDRTDATGFVTFRGLSRGTYAIEARVTGEHRATSYARIRRPGSPENDRLELQTVPPEKYELEVSVYPGASIEGLVVCDDAGPVPPMASFRAYPADAEWGAIELGPGSPLSHVEVEPEAVLSLDEILLTGRHSDRFVVGPFETGAYVLALRPIAHDPWSWVYGSDLREDAARLQLLPGRPTGIGTVEALCGPSVLLEPVIRSREAIPDMLSGAYEVEATARADNGDELTVHPIAEPRRGHVLVRNLVPGAIDLRVTIRHPHLIPARVDRKLRTLELDRGVREIEPIEFEAVGGALTVHTAAPAVRLSAEGRESITAVAADAVARLEGIFAGEYLLQPCSDLACATPKAPGVVVKVEQRRTREIDLRHE